MSASTSRASKSASRNQMRRSIAAFISLVFSAGSGRAEEQNLIVHFRYGSTNLERLYELEEKIEAAIEAAHAGEFDGDEIATDGSDGFLYMFGPSADHLFEVVTPVLKTVDFMQGAEVTRKYGPMGKKVQETTIVLPDK